jgi:hypothetical protein
MNSMSSPEKSAPRAELSDYEKSRAQNIERNNARLKTLGLISEREESASNALAWRKESPPIKEKNVKKKLYADAKSSKRKRSDDDKTTEAPASRSKSLRLQGRQPDGEIATVQTAPQHEEELEDDERQARVQECRRVRQQLALDLSKTIGGAETAARENPTATYEHCLMRARSMSEKALANRVKAIERAAGKHCVVKMAIFKSCLQDEGMWELSELASSSLERLKALQPPPPQE